MTRLRFLIICPCLLVAGSLSLPEKHVALFIFGDSLFDAGNNNYINTTTDYQANFLPYGQNFFKYPTGRFSNGRIIPDFIAEYAKLPLIPTFLPSINQEFTSGVNFTSGGAGALTETHQGLAISLKTQVSNFQIVETQLKQKLGDAAAKTLVSNAVSLLDGGANDYIVALTTNSSVLRSIYSKKQYVDMVIGNLTTIVKEIYKKGGRKFGILNLGPMGCVPAMKELVPSFPGSCLEDGVELPKLHNKALFKALVQLESQLKGIVYANHDSYNSILNRINNPSKYGLSSCGGKRGIKEYEICDDPDEYVFFDSLHLSEKANKQISKLIWSGTPDVTRPYNLKTLFELTYS
ncbi:GDSL esterase/lipase 1 [Citrus sinensis]|uniref:GDSL esterase/lipase 1 n=1 Tax=Citrus sinensis TaxID=2711 RepID=A0ACB8JAB4_CITSI|nr:GDSL esterase/lipase 1 [Citrus sinensis]